MTITLTREEAQQVLDCLAFSNLKEADAAAKTLRTRLAQPEQEPVAWISHNAGLYHGKPDELLNPLPLYTAPPKKEWVGLTDEEYEEMAEQYVTNCYFDTLEYAKNIEAKLKEKNGF